MYKDEIFCASLGDSRAIIGTDYVPELMPQTYIGQFHQNLVLEQVKKRRNSVMKKTINALQLTFDQKPDLPEEYSRITQYGARVEQSKNNQGTHVGPFRVWEMDSDVPGISVS